MTNYHDLINCLRAKTSHENGALYREAAAAIETLLNDMTAYSQENEKLHYLMRMEIGGEVNPDTEIPDHWRLAYDP